jgi:8-amino-7-oxononanoate synthase
MEKKMNYIKDYLRKQEKKSRLRSLTGVAPGSGPGRIVLDGRELVNLASNDYLGLKDDPRLAEAAAEAAGKWGAGAGGSRLICGTTELHERLESELAEFHGAGAALLFSSGYAAGVGVIPALAGRSDRVYLDRLCHACLYDGAVMSRAVIRRFRHGEPEHLEYLLKKDRDRSGRALVVTDTVFSMDGDRAPLEELDRVCRENSALLLVDEAHAVGVLGPQGKGLAAEAGLDPEEVLVMGTLGKAFGVAGAYLVCSPTLREYFINTCRSFIFSTSVPPPVVGAVLEALEIICQAEDSRKKLAAMSERLRTRLKDLSVGTLGSSTQIVPALVGEDRKALELADKLRTEKIFAPAVRPPTVPEGSSRIRFSLSAAITEQDFEMVLDGISRVMGGGKEKTL